MADTSIPHEAGPVASTPRDLFAAYRHAHAEWELAAYRPGESLSDDEGNRLCCATDDAMWSFLLAPADGPDAQALKIETFIQEFSEELHEVHPKAFEFLRVLARDMRRLADA